MSDEPKPPGTTTETDAGKSGDAASTSTKDGDPKAPPASGLVDLLKSSFAAYINEHEVTANAETGNLDVDLGFVKEHGGPLVARLLRDVTASVLPGAVSFAVPAAKTNVGAGAKTDAGGDNVEAGASSLEQAGAAKPGVNVNFDLSKLLSRLMTPARPSPKAPAAAPSDTPAAAPSDTPNDNDSADQ